MSDFKIIVDEAYLLSIGRATYNFTYLEKIVIDIITKLNGKGLPERKRKYTAGDIRLTLENLIKNSPNHIQVELSKFDFRFDLTIKNGRNKLLHAHPYTAINGAQQIGYPDQEWTLTAINTIAKEFEDLALQGSAIYYRI